MVFWPVAGLVIGYEIGKDKKNRNGNGKNKPTNNNSRKTSIRKTNRK